MKETLENSSLDNKEISGLTSFLGRKPAVSFLSPPVRGRKLETFGQCVRDSRVSSTGNPLGLSGYFIGAKTGYSTVTGQ